MCLVICSPFFLLEHLYSPQRKLQISKQLAMYASEYLLAMERNKPHVTLQVSLEDITLSCFFCVRQKHFSVLAINQRSVLSHFCSFAVKCTCYKLYKSLLLICSVSKAHMLKAPQLLQRQKTLPSPQQEPSLPADPTLYLQVQLWSRQPSSVFGLF